MDELRKKYKLIIYTALIGPYDELIEVNQKFLPNETLLICFTNNKKVSSKSWKIEQVECPNNDFAYMNRKIKILFMDFLPNHDYNIYIDANIRIKNSIKSLIQALVDSKFDLVIPKHYSRDCIYEEANPIILLGKEKEMTVLDQIRRYETEGFPKKFGLSENNIIFRKNSQIKLEELMRCWWNEYAKGAKRDQLSLMYCIWKINYTKYKLGMLSSRRNRFFGLELHKAEKKAHLIKGGFSTMKKMHDNYQPLPNIFSLVLVHYKNILDKVLDS